MSALPQHLLDWGELTPLKLKARQVADGLYAGGHRSRRRGSGIEFDGHRDYVPGDDLRRLDYRALMRHGRLLVRQFETDTDRSLYLLVDATRSMAYRSESAVAAKLAYAALLGAALGRIAVATGDRVALDWLGGESPMGLPSSGGRDAFERLVVALEQVKPGGEDLLAGRGLAAALQSLARRARRGAVIVVLSDLLDLPADAAERIAALGGRDRRLLVVQVLDPAEANFPFDGAVRLKPSVGSRVVETDAPRARKGYLEALARLQQAWSHELVRQGGRLLPCSTDERPGDVLRRLLGLVEGAAA